ncbi:SCO2322 family protein [Nonomuraea angiospora]|uniref:SCO2322 family protein n=1 Tax=Nonomuraea angiospora TaxID=46172 RepID=UPI0029AF6E46|nr:SCO2322 family protein [Nonomuraea angiospora]MDX3107238.1 SCO2322 family protein [Nonomuraea angiospora]
MLRAYRVAAGVALGAAAFLSLPSSALADAPADPGVPRTWSAWQSDGTAWLAVTPDAAPPDGSVIGWRFSVAPDGARGESPGGDLPSFQAVCGRDAAGSGHKRVVVAVDFGDGEADAYPGERTPAQSAPKCVTGAEDATAAQLLASTARVRVNAQGAVVAVADYPSSEKGGSELTAAAASAAPSGSGLPITLVAAGAGALALLAGGAVAATRRRSRTGV